MSTELDPEDDYDESECWLCPCGNYITNGLHCPNDGIEPPWGCPCSTCQNGDDEDSYLDYGGPYEYEPEF